MSFQDEVAHTVEKALEERRSEDNAVTAFEREWQEMRQSLVLPLFQEAARAFGSKLHGGHSGLVNGSVILSTKWENREHSLGFRPDKKEKVVVCYSTFQDDPEESFTLDALSEDIIKDKVQAFAYRIARGKKREDGSVYESRGLFVV